MRPVLEAAACMRDFARAACELPVSRSAEGLRRICGVPGETDDDLAAHRPEPGRGPGGGLCAPTAATVIARKAAGACGLRAPQPQPLPPRSPSGWRWSGCTGKR